MSHLPLSPSAERALDALFEVSARSCGVSLSGLLQLGPSGTRTLAGHGHGLLAGASLPPALWPTPGSPVWLANALTAPELAREPWVQGSPSVRFFAAVTLPGHPELALFVADRLPRQNVARSDLEALRAAALVVAALLTPDPVPSGTVTSDSVTSEPMQPDLPASDLLTTVEPAPDSQAALQAHAEHLRRDLAVAQATLGVYALAELDLEPAELMQEAMRLIGADGNLDWCGVLALEGDQARLVGGWHVPGAADFARSVQATFPRTAHDWLWWAAGQAEPVTLDHLAPGLRGAPLLSRVQGLSTLPLGRYGGAVYVLVGLQLLGRDSWTERDRSLMKAVARVIRQTLERQAQAEQLATRHAELQYTLDHAPLILWRTDERGVFQEGQGQGLRLMGLNSQSLAGASALEVYRDFPDAVNGLRRGLAGEMHLGQSSVGGREYETFHQPLWDTHGKQTGLLGLSYDVTARVHAERRASALLRISQLLSDTAELPEVAGQVLQALAGALPLDWLVLWQREGELLRALAVWGEQTPEVERVQRHGVPVACLDGSGVLEGRVASAQGAQLPAPLVAAGVLSGTMLPVWLGDPARGVLLGAFCRREQPLAPDQHELLEVAAQTLHTAVTRREQTRALREQALSDPLTGLGNRRALDADLGERLATAGARGESLSVISIDIDGFKGVNDRRGHAAGDELLVNLGHALRSSLRAGDRIYRVGGDEVVVLMTHPLPEAPPLAVRMARAVEQLRGAGFPEIDLSWGQAMTPVDPSCAASLLRLSDERLYAHKRRLLDIPAPVGLETAAPAGLEAGVPSG